MANTLPAHQAESELQQMLFKILCQALPDFYTDRIIRQERLNPHVIAITYLLPDERAKTIWVRLDIDVRFISG